MFYRKKIADPYALGFVGEDVALGLDQQDELMVVVAGTQTNVH
jgi:hypothetical protein